LRRLSPVFYVVNGMSGGNIISMTGFGSGRAEGPGAAVRATVRSLNGRFLDVQVRCPAPLRDMESAIGERVQEVLARGKVTVLVELEESPGVDDAGPVLDLEAARRYIAGLRRLAEAEGIEPAISLGSVAGMPGVFRNDPVQLDADSAAPLVLAAVEEALRECNEMRMTEGQALAADLRTRVDSLKKRQGEMEVLAAGCREKHLTRLREKVASLLEPGAIDEDRLVTEVVLMAERSDVAEELVRFRSHTGQFAETLKAGGDVGKRLNFLLQEMHREANTIGSKATATEIVHEVLAVKEEIERMREQVQNLA
jgi:uncharacterized protein (TIGR00255 family)